MDGTHSLPEFVTHRRGAKTVLAHPDYEEKVTGALFDGAGCVSADLAGRGGLQRFEYGGGTGLVRRYFRGGLVRHFLRETYLFQDRAARELALQRYAYEHEVPVAMPLGIISERRGPFFRGAIAFEELTGGDLLAYLSAEHDDAAAISAKCGQAIWRMHDAGIFHADLQIRNIFVGSNGIYLLDFDKARRLEALDETQRRTNLARLRRSFLKREASLAFFDALQEAYDRESSEA